MTSTPSRRAALSQRSTTGARSTTGSSPTTSTASAERREESGARNASSAGSMSSGRSAEASALEPDPNELRERPGCLVRLRARVRDHDRPSGLAEPALGLVDGLLPRDRLEAAPAHSEERRANPVGGAHVVEREAALVAEPAVVDLGMVPREDARRLPLPRRHPDVAARRGRGRRRSARCRSPTGVPGSDRSSAGARRPGRARSRCRRSARGRARSRRWR